MFQLGKQVERLQAVDAQSLEKIVVGSELRPLYFEVSGREAQYFVQRLIGGTHNI